MLHVFQGRRKRRVLLQRDDSSSDSDYAVTDLNIKGFILRKVSTALYIALCDGSSLLQSIVFILGPQV